MFYKQKLSLKPSKAFRIIYILLVSPVTTVLENKNLKLYFEETLATLFFLGFLFSLYCFLVFGCAISDTCAAAQGY